MSSLRDIRQKIHSVENIKKITQAMERVAAVHLKRIQKKAEQSSPYAEKIKEILDKLVELKLKNPLFEERTGGRIGLIVLTGDKGLSGTFNANILSAAENFLKNQDCRQVDLILIGKKGIEHFRRKQWKISHQIENWVGKISFEEIKTLSNQLVSWFLEKRYDQIWMVRTQYISIMKKEVIVEKFLNITKKENQPHIRNLNFILEPSGKEILAELLPRYFLTQIKKALDSSHTAELAARIVAMQAAGNNSEKMIGELTLKKNKMRQRDITREMIEISSGAKG